MFGKCTKLKLLCLDRMSEDRDRRVRDLFDAVSADNDEQLTHLISKGGQLNPEYDRHCYCGPNFYPPYYGKSLIRHACDNNSQKCVRVLLTAGLNVNDGRHGISPLMHACSSNAYETAEILCAYGADVNAKSDFGMSVLDWICSPDVDAVKFVKLILRNGFNVNTVRVPYALSVDAKYQDVVDILRAAGVTFPEPSCRLDKFPQVITINQSGAIVNYVVLTHCEMQEISKAFAGTTEGLDNTEDTSPNVHLNLADLARSRICGAILKNYPNLFVVNMSTLRLPKLLERFLLYDVEKN